MPNNKKELEKEQLMEKVFGKNAPKRSISQEDMDILKSNPLSGENLSPEWKTIEENSRKLQEQTQAMLDKFTDEDFESLKNELRKDFGDQLPLEQQEELTIIRQQKELSAKFREIEEMITSEILAQDDFVHDLITAYRRPTVMGLQNNGLKGAILIIGPAATGRHTSVQLATKYLADAKIIGNPNLAVIDMALYRGKEDENTFIQDLYTAANKSQVIVFDHIENIAPSYLPYIQEILGTGELTLSKRYVLKERQLVETANTLVKDTVKSLQFKGKYLIFITSKDTDKLLEIVGSHFIKTMSDVIRTDKIDKEDLRVIYHQKKEQFVKKCQENLGITLEIDDSLEQFIVDNYMESANVAYLTSLLDRTYDALAEFRLKNIDSSNDSLQLFVEDNKMKFRQQQQTTDMDDYLPKVLADAKEEVRKELDSLVGLDEIKQYVLSLEDFYEAQKLREKQGLKTTEVSKHMIFTGNPGTGKTTIARLLAKYLQAIGVLSNGQLVEVSRNDLVGKYLGHTAPQTMQVIKSALGGILFIDEAYSLYRGTNDSFGLEAIDTLVKAMEDNRDDLIVILAGYTKEMKVFLESNSGLASRFPNQIEFPDYTAVELYQITEIMAHSKGYRLAPEIKEPLIEYYAVIQETNARKAGNGRMARNMVEEAIIHQSKRIISDPDAELDLLMLDDLDLKINDNI
ncbi:MAG: AAA family ATPase [Erysipelotrichaceae bacterium]|nr:AAA family ATPase [Erysipelotrichaceae bacterium]